MRSKMPFELRGECYHDPTAELEISFTASHFQEQKAPFLPDELERRAADEAAEPDKVRLQWRERIVGHESVEQLRAKMTASGGASPASSREAWLAMNAAIDILALDAFNMEAAEALVALLDCPAGWTTPDGVASKAAQLLAVVRGGIETRTPAFELLRSELTRFFDTDDPQLFMRVMPIFLPERPVSTILRCYEFLKSPDREVRWKVGGALWAQGERGLVPTRFSHPVLREWLANETDLLVLLVVGKSPVVPASRLERIFRDGLAHRSPTLREFGCIRAAQELDPVTAIRLIEDALEDEPDELLRDLFEAALAYVKRLAELERHEG